MRHRLAGLLFVITLGFGFALLIRDSEPELPVDLARVDGTPPVTDFELDTLDDRRRRLSQLKGRVVLVNFWATWCLPCREEMPSLKNAALAMDGKAFTVLAVNFRETDKQVARFVNELGFDSAFEVLLDRDGVVFEQIFDGRGLPTSFIIDKAGNIAYRAEGPRQFDSGPILKTIRKLIAAN